MNRRIDYCGAVLVLLVALSGCGSELVNVSGKITYKGQPVPSTLVIFKPDEEGKRASQGKTDDDGNFKLTYSRSENGVSRGPCTVFLRYHQSADEEMGKIKPKASKEMKAGLAKYENPKSSPLHYEITKNGQFIEINLE